MKRMKRCLAILLAFTMMFTCSNATVFAEEFDPAKVPEVVAEPAETEENQTEATETAADDQTDAEESEIPETDLADGADTEADPEKLPADQDVPMLLGLNDASTGGTLDTSEFYKMVLIDCGRGYYSVDNIKAIIDTMAECDYEYLMLGFGNDGLRFVLDDMSVTANGTTYASSTVKNAVISANDTLQNNNGNGQWTQAQMDSVISYAASKGISIVPLVNSPGHAYSICKAIEACGIGGLNTAFYQYGTSGAVNQYNYSLNLSNSDAVAFSEALIQKYIDYFAEKGCKFFNFGCDETKNTTNAQVVSYVNNLCSMLPDTMVPMAFCDILKNTSGYPENLVGIDWDGGHLSNSNKHMNANDNWYYVLGNSETADGWSTYYRAFNQTKSIPVTTTLGGETAYGSILAVWNDSYLASDSYIDNIQNLLVSQAEANPTYFSNVISYDTTKEITVEVNETKTDTIDGSASIVSNPDTAIATVTANTTEGSSETTIGSAVTEITSGTKYVIALNRSGVTSNTVLTSTASGSQLKLSGTPSVSSELWTVTKSGSNYYVQNSAGKYLTIGSGTASVTSTKTALTLEYVSSASSWQLKSNSYYLNQYGGSGAALAGGWTSGASSDAGSRWSLYPVTTGTVASTNVSFTGVSVGDTTSIVGNVKYNIHVVAEDVSTKTLTYYPFLSDYEVYPEGTGASNCSGTEGTGNAQTLAATVAGVNTEDGIDISTVAWATGDWRWEGDAVQTVYWKGVLHNTTDTKQIGKQSDQSLSGIDFKYVRYLNGTWAVSADRETWTAVTADDEVCVYYLQETEVTSEVTTYVKDWAFTTKEYSSYGSDSRGHKALSFAVVYPDGQMSPAADSIYDDSTMIYWYNTGVTSDTDTMLIRFGINDIYEVSKITYTYGTIATESSTGGSLTWETKTVDDTTWYDETTYWDDSLTTEPVVKTNDFLTYGNNKFDASGDAMLILIYLKPVVSEDSLTVQYWDDNANAEILNYALNIKNESTSDKGTFVNRLMDKDGNKVNPTAGSDLTLADDAYVENYAGTKETFQKDLTKIPSLLGGLYSTGLYEYQKAELSEDGKTLILHYNLKDEIDAAAKYVVDFGLQISNIKVADLLPAGSQATVKAVAVRNGSYGTVTASGTSTITYTLDKVMYGKDVFIVTLTLNDGSKLNRNVEIYPATTVYYEEGFAEATGFTGGAKGTGTQATQKLGASTDEYGYDSAYAGTIGASNGTEATSSDRGDKLTFTFKGTGVDIFANCSDSTGKLNVQVWNSSGKVVKLADVNTVTTGIYGISAAAQYNLPVFAISGLTYDEYTVKIFNATSASSTAKVKVDGFKVYNTIEDTDKSKSPYKEDFEDCPAFYELRNELLFSTNTNIVVNGYEGEENSTYPQVLGTGNTTTGIILSNDGEGNYDLSANSILTDGPKNELFLRAGDTLTFKVATGRDLQIGMKAVTAATSCTINGSSIDLNGTTDMFYKVAKTTGATEQTVTIVNTGKNVLSITKLKVCDDPNFAFVALTNDDLKDAFVALGLVEEPEVEHADANLSISLKDYTGKTFATTSLTANGIAGETATFSAADIQAAAEAVLPSGYGFAATAVDAAVVYGENGSAELQIGKVATLKITYKKGKKVVGTATLTAVQTSKTSSYTFSSKEIKAATPSGYTTISLAGTKVNFGSTKSINASCY